MVLDKFLSLYISFERDTCRNTLVFVVGIVGTGILSFFGTVRLFGANAFTLLTANLAAC